MNIHFDWLAPIYDRVISQPEPDKLRQLLGLPAGRLLEAGGGTGGIGGCPPISPYPLRGTGVLTKNFGRSPIGRGKQRRGDVNPPGAGQGFDCVKAD